MPDHYAASRSERARTHRNKPLRFDMAIAALLPLTLCLTGCQVVEGIFKAGFWVGALAVIAVIALLIFVAVKALS